MKEIFDNSKDKTESEIRGDEITLHNFTVNANSKLLNSTIRESGIRTHAKALVVGIERNGMRSLNPESTVMFLEGDIVWVVGVKAKIKRVPCITEKKRRCEPRALYGQ